MLAVIALMYSKQALGLMFHEIGGLILIGAFFIHKGLNFEWIRRVTVRLFRADKRTRLLWIVDALMLLGFLAVGVSGILISKVAFPGLAVRGGPWKAVHYGGAALSLILVGVHLGLHLNFLKGTLSRWVRLPRVVAALVTVAVMAYGVYGLSSTSFLRWLSMPFAAAEGGEGYRGGGTFPGDRASGGQDALYAQDAAGGVQPDGTGDPVYGDTSAQTADGSQSLADFASGAQVADVQPPSASDPSAKAADVQPPSASDPPIEAADSLTADAAIAGESSAGETGSRGNQARGKGEGQRGMGSGGPGGHEASGSFASALTTLAQFFSITFLFAALTAFADIALRRKKQRAHALR